MWHNSFPEKPQMRRDLKDRDEKGRVKFRFIEFEMDANDPTLQETLRNITAAIGKTSGSHIRSHDSAPQLPPASESLNPPNINAAPPSSDNSPSETTLEGPKGDARSAKRSSPRSPKVLDDLTLEDVDQPLKDFIEEKSPTGENQRYLAIAWWLKNKRGLAEITMDHIHTCYRHLGWHTPKDASGRCGHQSNRVISPKPRVLGRMF
jgi:hypothetical protein